MFTNEQLLWAFTLTLLAGLSTGIGALIVLTVKHQSKSLLSNGSPADTYGDKEQIKGVLALVGGSFIGMAVMAISLIMLK